MKCHTQRAKQAAQWLVEAAWLKINYEPKSQKAQDSFSCLRNRALFSIYVRRCECGCERYVCMQIQCSIPPLIFHFSAEVMYCIELSSSFILSNLSSSPSLCTRRIFCANSMFTLKISSITCTRTVWSKEQSDEYKVAFVSRLNIVSSTIYWVYWEISIFRLSLAGLFPCEHYIHVIETGCYCTIGWGVPEASRLTTLQISPLWLAVGRAYL